MILLSEETNRKVELVGIAAIQWESAASIVHTPRLHRYMADLREWAQEEANAYGLAPAAMASVIEDHVQSGRKGIAKFLYVRERELTLIIFLSDLLRDPDLPNFTGIALRN